MGKVIVFLCVLILLGCRNPLVSDDGSNDQPVVENQAPAASFYDYDLRVSGSDNSAVNGDYINDEAARSSFSPGYRNSSNIYIYTFKILTDFYWGISDDYNQSNLASLQYYQSFLYADLKMAPATTGWTPSLASSAISLSIGTPITGSFESGGSVTGSYLFSDPDGDSEGISTYKWFLCTTNGDADEGEEIVGANSLSYTFPDGNIETVNGSVDKGNKYLKFEVTPVDEFGKAGTPLKSSASLNSFPGL